MFRDLIWGEIVMFRDIIWGKIVVFRDIIWRKKNPKEYKNFPFADQFPSPFSVGWAL